MQARLGLEALQAAVEFSEHLSNRLLAANIGTEDGSQRVVVNARFKIDPEILAHSLVEEFAPCVAAAK